MAIELWVEAFHHSLVKQIRIVYWQTTSKKSSGGQSKSLVAFLQHAATSQHRGCFFASSQPPAIILESQESTFSLVYFKLSKTSATKIPNSKSNSGLHVSASGKNEKFDSLSADATLDSAIDDPIRVYLMQMGRIPLLTREEEVSAAVAIDKARFSYRNTMLATDFMLQGSRKSTHHGSAGTEPENTAEATGSKQSRLRNLDRKIKFDQRTTIRLETIGTSPQQMRQASRRV